jgi:predicted permease
VVRFGFWIPRVQEVTLDGRVLVFALGATLTAGLVAALAPAVCASRVPIRALIGNQRGAVQGGRNLPGGLLVSCEVALALILLTGGGLLLRSFRAVLSQDLGYDPAGVIAADVALPPPEYRQDTQRPVAFWDELLRRTRELPGVAAAGLANWIPTGTGGSTFLEFEGRAASRAGAGYRIASDDYFESLRIPVVAGRVFDSRDTPAGERVVVINRQFADAFWPGENPIGKRTRAVSMEGFQPGGAPWLTVIGVVEGVRHWAFERAPQPEMFVLYRQIPSQLTSMTLIVRTGVGTAAQLTRALRGQLRALDPGVGADIGRLEERVEALLSERRLTLSLLGAFANLALLLSAIGVYGLMSFAVARRTHEIGVRSALGASRYGLLGLVLGNAFRVVIAGALAGLLGAYWLTRLMSAMLFETSAADIISYGAAALVILFVSMLAALIPAWRASRSDPLIALRS